MNHLYLDIYQIKTINFTFQPQLPQIWRALFITPTLYSWGHVSHFLNNNFTPNSSIIQIFIVIPALAGTPNQPSLLSLPASTRGNAISSSKEGDLLYSVHCILHLSQNLCHHLSLHKLVNILHSRFLQRFRNFHISVIWMSQPYN